MLYGQAKDGGTYRGLKVLILIFLENALRRLKAGKISRILNGLNPYFFGKCSTAVPQNNRGT